MHDSKVLDCSKICEATLKLCNRIAANEWGPSAMKSRLNEMRLDGIASRRLDLMLTRDLGDRFLMLRNSRDMLGCGHRVKPNQTKANLVARASPSSLNGHPSVVSIHGHAGSRARDATLMHRRRLGRRWMVSRSLDGGHWNPWTSELAPTN